MSDQVVLVKMEAPLRRCSDCTWRGVILSETPAYPTTPPILEFEGPVPADEDPVKFCPTCGEPLVDREAP